MAPARTRGRAARGFDLKGLLESIDQPPKRGVPKSSGDERTVSNQTRRALSRAKISGKMRWLLERRATDDGQLLRHVLRQPRLDRAEHVERLRVERARAERNRSVSDGAPAAAGCNWFSVGPRNINGRIKSLAVHPNGTTVYAGAADGGVWKSTDSGQSWTPTMHDELSLAIGALALDPNAAQTIYAGTGEPVYLIGSSGVEPPGSPDLAWFYEGVGIYKSTNGGDTWNLTGAIDNDFIYRIAVDPNDSNNVLCAGYSSTVGTGGLCRSTNGGTTWTTVVTGIFTDVLFDPNNAGRVFAGQLNGGVLKSTDSGATWSARNTGLPAAASIARVSLTIAAANSNVLYAKIESASSGGLLGVYRTASAAEAPGGWSAVTNPGVDSSYVWWCSTIAADPSDVTGNIVWAGGVGLARSGDGGASWTNVGGAIHSDQQSMVFDPTNANAVYASNDGGVFRGVFSGGAPPVTWAKVSTGLAVTQFYDVGYSPASPSVFGGGAQDNGSMISPGGLSWRHVLGADGGYVGFHPTDPYTVYVQTQGGASIRRSTDGGTSFTSAASGISGSGPFPATVFAIDQTTPTVMFIGTNSVFRTATGGVGAGAWTASSGNLGTVTEIAIAPSSSAVVYAGTVSGGLYRATDGGITATSFTNITPAVAGFPTRWLAGIAVHPTDSNTVYLSFLGVNASGAANQVWKGVFDPMTTAWNWVQRTGGLPNVPAGAIVIDPGTMDLYLATDIGVFRSTNDGVTWTPFEAGLPNTAVVDLALDAGRGVLRAATHGRGMWEIRLGVSCPEVDIYLRDSVIDTGEFTPSADGLPDPTRTGAFVHHWESIDIKVDAPPYDVLDAVIDGVEFDNPDQPSPIETIAGITHNNPIRSQTNHVYVQVHNRGWKKADQVRVKLLWADAGVALPALPSDFWANYPGDGFDQTHWKPLGTTVINDLLPWTPRVLVFDWVPPATVSTHACLLAMVDSPQDPLTPQTELNVDILTPTNKRVTHKNVHPVDAPAPGGAPGWVTVDLNNGFREAHFFDFFVERMQSGTQIRIILPRVDLIRGLKSSMRGLTVSKVGAARLRQQAERARKAGHLDRYIHRLLGKLKEPLILDASPRAKTAGLTGILIKPNRSIPVLIQFDNPKARPGSTLFVVTQRLGGRLVGGSTFTLAEEAVGKADKKAVARRRSRRS
jgi:hypothetical protein